VKAEVLVIGGGLAGSAAAIALAKGGREVVLVEREARPQHKVCGEFLSREALAYLRVLGVDVGALGAVPISAVRLAGADGAGERGGLSDYVPRPKRGTLRLRSGQAAGTPTIEVALPFVAMSLTRLRLDEALLRLAVEAGVRVVHGCSVEGLEAVDGGWRARVSGRSEVGLPASSFESDAVFLATGKHDLRGWARPAGRQNDLVAFKMYWRLTAAQAAALDGHVELILYRGGYAGLQPVEEGAANLCCLIERGELQRLGGRWEKLLAAMLAQSAHLRERLQGAEALLERPLAVSAIPYGLVRERADGVWRLGDQAAVIPSFTGDGMSIALHTGLLAARMYLGGESAESFQQRAHGELARQVGLATWVSRGLVERPALLGAAARVWPGALRLVAAGTRISAKAMLT
jgi:flavin-dependent dehydrogenase